jgi:uncharacterized protein
MVVGWLCAFVIGYSINQGGTCAVAAARDLVHERRIAKFVGLVAATGAAGLVSLPAVWLLGTGGHIGGMAPIAPGLFIGAVLLGLGVALNDACLLGSLWRLGNGELRLLALPVGLAIGFLAAGTFPGGIAPIVTPSALIHPSGLGAVVVAGSAVIFIAALFILRRMPPRSGGRWPLSIAMTLLGSAGALLYVLQPGWSYADAIRRGVEPVMAMMTASWGSAVAALMTVGGAVVSATRLGAFDPTRPRATDVLRSLGGGVLIAFGATMIPGGNDTLLLASVPAGSVSGAVAFTVMTLTVIAIVTLRWRLGAGLPGDSDQTVA